MLKDQSLADSRVPVPRSVQEGLKLGLTEITVLVLFVSQSVRTMA